MEMTPTDGAYSNTYNKLDKNTLLSTFTQDTRIKFWWKIVIIFGTIISLVAFGIAISEIAKNKPETLPRVNSNISLVDEIQNKQFNSFQEQINNLTIALKQMQHQFTNETLKKKDLPKYLMLADGWVAPLNGYEYKLTPGKQNWQNSRQICQEMVADLAVYGVQNWAIRMIIIDGLKIYDNITWLGMNDRNNEGEWRWVDGNPVTHQNGHWNRGEPDNVGEADCGNMNPRGNDAWCTDRRLALCEKKLH